MLFGILVVVIYFIKDFLNPVKQTVKPRVIIPLPKLMDLAMFQVVHRESLYWGTYRPNVYFGIRARTLLSLLAGLMWIGVKDGRYLMRHVCQDSDELSSYGWSWTQHNGRDYGRQVLVDQDLTLTTSFLKSKDKESGYGGDWGVQIEAQSEKKRREYLLLVGRDSATFRELNPKSLSSGLDHYPRASHPIEDECHLDIRCWMHVAADCMHSISEFLEDRDAGKEYGRTAKLLSDFKLLNQIHFDHAYGAYFDYGNHSEKVRLSWRLVGKAGNYPTRELVREVLEKPELKLVPHIGYVSLFPFMGRLIPPESWILEKQLDLISNKSTLWTNYGLRSLAKTSSIYMQRNTEHDPPYWRGQIWMNMNYLILSSLHYYSEVDGPYKDRAKVIYNDLRNNLIGNVIRNYKETGYLWEQYDPKKGKGKGARPFTGWTALIVLIMAEAYTDC